MEAANIFSRTTYIQFVGAKNQGKTTLIQGILSIFKEKGLSVLTFKHSSHNHPIDKPDSDSDLLRKAGADVSIFQSGDGIAFFIPDTNNKLIAVTLQAIIDHIDLIIVESFSSLPGPKILVHRTNIPESLPENVIAIVGEKIPQLPGTTILPFNYHLVADFIISYFRLKKI